MTHFPQQLWADLDGAQQGRKFGHEARLPAMDRRAPAAAVDGARLLSGQRGRGLHEVQRSREPVHPGSQGGVQLAKRGTYGAERVPAEPADLLERALEHAFVPEEIEQRYQAAVKRIGCRPVALLAGESPQLTGVFRDRICRACDPADRAVDHRWKRQRVRRLRTRSLVRQRDPGWLGRARRAGSSA